MKELLLSVLYNNRLMHTDREFEIFENTLDNLCDLVDENDIFSLIKVLDDETEDSDAMFRIIHLFESVLSTRNSYEQLLKGVQNILKHSSEWCKIIMYRILNHDYSRKIIKEIFSVCNNDYDDIIQLLISIKIEDTEHFGNKVDEILC